MQGQAHAHAGHANAGHQRGDLESELVEGDEEREQHDGDLRHPHDEQTQGRFHRLTLQALVEETSGPARDEGAQDEDDEGAEHLEAVPDGEIGDEIRRGHGEPPGRMVLRV